MEYASLIRCTVLTPVPLLITVYRTLGGGLAWLVPNRVKEHPCLFHPSSLRQTPGLEMRSLLTPSPLTCESQTMVSGPYPVRWSAPGPDQPSNIAHKIVGRLYLRTLGHIQVLLKIAGLKFPTVGRPAADPRHEITLPCRPLDRPSSDSPT